jgi:adenylate kinase
MVSLADSASGVYTQSMEITKAQLEQIQTKLGTGSIDLFGRPFAGKDSQGAILVELFGGNLIGGGDILRNSVIPARVKAIMEEGKIVPSEDFVAIVLPYLSQKHLADQPLILSSAGRWHGEEESVMNALAEAGHPLRYVIYIRLSEDDVRKRWHTQENRADRGDRYDDSEELLETRFAEFAEKTLPVIEFYRERDMLIEVDGNQLREEVTKDILTQLLEKFSD